MSDTLRKSSLVLSLVFSLLFASCARNPTIEYLKGDTMGTYYTIQYWDETTHSSDQLTTSIESLLNEFEAQLSNWRKDSWISQFNAAPANQPIPVPEYALPVLVLCLELADRSRGALDPTISPLIKLWGFGTRKGHAVPSEPEIQTLLETIGYQHLDLDKENRSLRKTRDGVQLNCSAVAKGYAVDLVAQLLRNNGIRNFLINMGGEIAASGSKPDGEPWKVGLRQPHSDGVDSKSEVSFRLVDQALATSGHSQRSFVLDGKRYSHILNPKTGYPVPAETASATVIAPTCALADGLATLALILSEAQMNELVENYDEVKVFRTAW